MTFYFDPMISILKSDLDMVETDGKNITKQYLGPIFLALLKT